MDELNKNELIFDETFLKMILTLMQNVTMVQLNKNVFNKFFY